MEFIIKIIDNFINPLIRITCTAIRFHLNELYETL